MLRELEHTDMLPISNHSFLESQIMHLKQDLELALSRSE